MNAGGFGQLVTGFDASHTFLPEPDTLFAMIETPQVRELRFIDMSLRVSAFQDYVDGLWVPRLGDGLDATPVPILEPLKVRIITKGQAAEYYRCIELQKLMHGALRKHPVFQCIGHPIEDIDWADTFRSRDELMDDEFFVSGDYKAATDNLRSDLSEYTWKCICRNVRLGWDSQARLSWTKYEQLGLKALTGHRLHYGRETVSQTWGQLMGSPMSFPILCIVNAAATLVSLEEDFSPDNRIRVNGDDIAFIANPARYERWKEVTHLCGLDFSIGKNYTSREFIIMNSELRRAPMRREWVDELSEDVYYEWEGDDLVTSRETFRVPVPWKFEGFTNQCLLYNKIKKGMDAGQLKDTYWVDLSSISGELLRGIPPKDQWKLYGIFFKTYESQIREAPKNANKWFPKALGGMGLSLPGGEVKLEKIGVKLDTPNDRLEKQRKLAAFLACDPERRLKRVSLKRQIFGALGQTFEDIRRMSDAQVPRVLHTKLRNRECTPIMGGKTLLGYLLGTSHMAGGDYDQDGRWMPAPMGGYQPERSSEKHLAVAADLRLAYRRWTDGFMACSLHPMDVGKIFGYSEHLELSSYIEVMQDGPSLRCLD